MAITDWPAAERPREKLLDKGPAALSDAELLAIFLRTGVRGKTAVDLGRLLLQEFGGLRNIVAAKQERFCQSHGLGTAKYVQLQAVLEIARRYLQENLERSSALTNPYETRHFLTSRLRNYEREVFACLFLDNAHRVIRYDELFQGTINSTTVHPREVVKQALNYNAAAVIFAHNHPSGVAEPSASDQYVTQQLKQALQLIDVRVLDHIIVGDGQVTSFVERGLL